MDNGIAKVSEISWTQGQHHTLSISDIIAQQSDQIFTVFILVITAFLCLALLFIAAMFIDCRNS
nr:unnamed protein product [Callosobruchus analis]CAI5838946.1 unnamed protein product [Callosobruchus analis]